MKPKRSNIRNYFAARNNLSGSDVSIENEPMPMKDKKPAHKHPNAADNFRNTHQFEYDDRGRPPKRCGYVDTHNDACPKLKDELDKKRDTTKPIACQTIQQLFHAAGILCATQTLVSEQDWSDPNCIMCSQRKRARTLSNRIKQRERRRRDSRVSKSRRRPPPRRPITINKAHITNTENQNVERQNLEDLKSSKLNVDKYPDTTPSMTSYNSYLSMDHEPMCSK